MNIKKTNARILGIYARFPSSKTSRLRISGGEDKRGDSLQEGNFHEEKLKRHVFLGLQCLDEAVTFVVKMSRK